ncbi:uncharacterized protein [Epargyreus clarus]|uniref:uncharacterized protein isoform X2 n=1 Tax=Epargyreus clarus TaxID=520877 RepID=UPI003C2F2DCC
MARGHNAHRSPRPQRHVSPRSTQINKQPFKVNFQNYINIGKKYFKKAYSTMNDRYLAVFTILLVVILTFLLPDISSKIQKTNELKAMKNTLDLMATEVNRAEVACLTVADNLCSIKNSMRDDQTETVSIRPEISENCQFVPAIQCKTHNQSRCKSRKKSVCFVESSSHTGTLPTKKSPSCPFYIATRSPPKRRGLKMFRRQL